jgi:hypothetical protein
VTTQTVTSCLALARPAVPAGWARLRNLPSVALRMTTAGAGAVQPYATHSQKRFAMAGIDANVWPLGPKEWTSG